jgi:menaquinone-dependent protoporphyrinogen oxidase
MLVLVAYASRHGSTMEIAERIAAGLQAAGLRTEVRSVDAIEDITPYDAFVIGGAAYMLHWLKEATLFVRRHRETLARRPTWLFSSGPLGTELVDKAGHDIIEVTRPREFDQLERMIHPLDEHVFFGAWDPRDPAVGLGEWLIRHLPASADIPVGDFRDWPAIDAWAATIASELRERTEVPVGARAS